VTPWWAQLLVPWARAFLFTQVVEAPIYRLSLRISWRLALLPSALTHPLVWFVFPELLGNSPERWPFMVVTAELFAWASEAWVLRIAAKVPWRRALFASLLANAVSLALGLLSRKLFSVP